MIDIYLLWIDCLLFNILTDSDFDIDYIDISAVIVFYFSYI